MLFAFKSNFKQLKTIVAYSLGKGPVSDYLKDRELGSKMKLQFWMTTSAALLKLRLVNFAVLLIYIDFKNTN